VQLGGRSGLLTFNFVSWASEKGNAMELHGGSIGATNSQWRIISNALSLTQPLR